MTRKRAHAGGKILVTSYPTLARCERDDLVFKPRVNEVKDSGGIIRQRYINCPRCFRGYHLEQDGTWMSDRALTILKGDEAR